MRTMPIDLTDAELATAAQACRAMAYQEGERAKEMENPTTRGLIENAAERYRAPAEGVRGGQKAGVGAKSNASVDFPQRRTVLETRRRGRFSCDTCS